MDTKRYRGSRKHILDWTARPDAVVELLELAMPVNCRLTAVSKWKPQGYGSPDEARLESFGPEVLPQLACWKELRSWWLKQERGANTPNWDLALQCEVEGGPGLILVEAKANIPELSSAGKSDLAELASANSIANHAHIGEAIANVAVEMQRVVPRIAIDRDRSYQLSNRIAFAWKLASFGIPTVLIYLGFMGDTGIRDVGPPLNDPQHWQQLFAAHLAEVCPNTDAILERRLQTSAAPMWLLCRSRKVIEPSPAAG